MRIPSENMADDVRSVRQSLEEVIRPAIARIETKQIAQDQEFTKLEDKVDSLNVKFYGILGGGGLGAVLAVGKAMGWF